MENKVFNIEIKKNEGSAIVKIDGDVNENFEVDISQLQGTNLINLDLSGVKIMNSSGVKRWFHFLESIPPSTTINYHNVPAIIVAQMNMVEGFVTPNTKVTSFYAPYFDEANDTEVNKLLKPSEVQNKKAPIVTNENGEELEFDALEETYFNFLDKLQC